jgi:hypothetical protein
VSPDNRKEVLYHVLAWEVRRPSESIIETIRAAATERPSEDRFLRVQIHERGRIENRVYRLGNAGQIGPQVALSAWDNTISEVQNTNVDDFLVVHIPNLQTTKSIFGLDDYRDIYSLVEGMAIRLAQNDHILDKHADPSMAGPINAVQVDDQGNYTFVGGGRYFPVGDDETPPGYITWDGNLVASFEQMDRMLQSFYIVSETSPAAFGQMDRVYAESGTALRRLMMVPLAKVNRTRLFVDPRLKRVIRIAADLERLNGVRTPELHDIDIEWHDGLPEDPREQAEIEQLRMAAGNSSVYSSIGRLDGGTEASIMDELDRIREEQAAQAGANGVPLNLQFAGLDDE